VTAAAAISAELPQPPTLDDVFRAERTIRPHLAPTPLYRHPGLCDLLDADVLVKHENHLPTGAFKVRGGVNLVANLTSAERRAGVVTASTGNHGQSIAWAGARFGVRAVLYAPVRANPVKVAAMRGFGGEVVLEGDDFEACKRLAEDRTKRDGMRFINSGDEPLLIAGVATHTLEILRDAPQLDVLIVPLGGGSGAAGAALAAKSLSPQTKVIAVQSSLAPAAFQTWRDRVRRTAPIGTVAGGLATGEPFMLPQTMLWDTLDEFVLVDDDALFSSMRTLVERAKTMAEPAGAAALAAAWQLRDGLRGKRVALIVSGGNVGVEELRRALDAEAWQR
jgi:threonine dehydratase